MQQIFVELIKSPHKDQPIKKVQAVTENVGTEESADKPTVSFRSRGEGLFVSA